MPILFALPLYASTTCGAFESDHGGMHHPSCPPMYFGAQHPGFDFDRRGPPPGPVFCAGDRHHGPPTVGMRGDPRLGDGMFEGRGRGGFGGRGRGCGRGRGRGRGHGHPHSHGFGRGRAFGPHIAFGGHMPPPFAPFGLHRHHHHHHHENHDDNINFNLDGEATFGPFGPFGRRRHHHFHHHGPNAHGQGHHHEHHHWTCDSAQHESEVPEYIVCRGSHSAGQTNKAGDTQGNEAQQSAKSAGNQDQEQEDDDDDDDDDDDMVLLPEEDEESDAQDVAANTKSKGKSVVQHGDAEGSTK